MNCSSPGSSVHRIARQGHWSRLPVQVPPPIRDALQVSLPNPCRSPLWGNSDGSQLKKVVQSRLCAEMGLPQARDKNPAQQRCQGWELSFPVPRSHSGCISEHMLHNQEPFWSTTDNERPRGWRPGRGAEKHPSVAPCSQSKPQFSSCVSAGGTPSALSTEDGSRAGPPPSSTTQSQSRAVLSELPGTLWPSRLACKTRMLIAPIRARLEGLREFLHVRLSA